MRPSWITGYLQLPFQEHGRTRAGLDCYGLVRLILAEQQGIALPSYAEDYATTTDVEAIAALVRGEVASAWRAVPVSEARLCDVAILRMAGQPMHVGLVLDQPYFVHTMRGAWSCVERWDALLWRKRLLGVVRWCGVGANEPSVCVAS